MSQRDLFNDVKTLHGTANDEYEVTAFQTTSSGQSGYTWIDAVRFEGARTVHLDDTEPTWSGGGLFRFSLDARVCGRHRVDPGRARRLGIEPLLLVSRSTCFSAFDIGRTPFLRWSWRKSGGGTVAISLDVQDTRDTSKTGTITDLRRALPADRRAEPDQVSPMVPSAWSQVMRNVADDARQVLGLFNDDPSNGSSGPVADPVQLTGYRLVADDGAFAAFDDLRSMSLTNIGDGQYGRPRVTTSW